MARRSPAAVTKGVAVTCLFSPKPRTRTCLAATSARVRLPTLTSVMPVWSQWRSNFRGMWNSWTSSWIRSTMPSTISFAIVSSSSLRRVPVIAREGRWFSASSCRHHRSLMVRTPFCSNATRPGKPPPRAMVRQMDRHRTPFIGHPSAMQFLTDATTCTRKSLLSTRGRPDPAFLDIPRPSPNPAAQ